MLCGLRQAIEIGREAFCLGAWRHTVGAHERQLNTGSYAEAPLSAMGNLLYNTVVLEKLVASGDVEAKLLTFEAKLRAGNSTDARELFTSIDSEKLLHILRFPYAAAMAHLVLVGRFSDLSERAISLLSSLPAAGGEQ